MPSPERDRYSSCNGGACYSPLGSNLLTIMNREQTLEAIKVMQAWCDGISLEARCVGSGVWYTCDPDSLGWNLSGVEFRIKPRPMEIEVWVRNEDGRILDPRMTVTPVGYTKKKFREVIE
jgi:hypothetical protein